MGVSIADFGKPLYLGEGLSDYYGRQEVCQKKNPVVSELYESRCNKSRANPWQNSTPIALTWGNLVHRFAIRP
ncbi:MAG: hypothetical protein C4324_05000 [Blastocatellia bacterium]